MMDRKRLNERGAIALGIAICALACAWLMTAPSARAASGHGSAELKLAQHDRGRTLSGQGVSILAGAPARKTGNLLSLPISSLELAAAPSAGSEGWIRFKRGKRAVLLSGIRLDLAAGTLNGNLGGRELAVFRLGAPVGVDAVAGTVALAGGGLRLTGAAATALREKLGLERALLRNGIGTAWLSAWLTASPKTDPKPTPPPKPKPTPVVRTVVSGGIEWGFKTTWRGYILSPPAGSQEVLDGATATGPLSSPATTYGFPGTGGSFTGVLGGAVDALTLASEGAVKWAKPAHGISEVRFSDLEIEIGSDGAWLIGDVKAEIGPPAEDEDVRIAELETTAVTPQWSAGNGAVTLPGVPATLTAEGAASFSGFYEAGTELDPVTITAELG